MVVLDSNSFVFGSTGRTWNVQSSSSDIGMAKNAPTVDRHLACDYPFPGEVCVLDLTNALYVPSMDHNWIPPFIMRASSVITNDFLKIHYKEPSVDVHGISFDQLICRHLSNSMACSHTFTRECLLKENFINVGKTSQHQIRAIRTLTIVPMSATNDECLTSKATCLNLLGDQIIKLCLRTTIMS